MNLVNECVDKGVMKEKPTINQSGDAVVGYMGSIVGEVEA